MKIPHDTGTGATLNDRFELRECLGSGGMGKVFKALDRRKLEANDRQPYVAVKVLNLEFQAHPDSFIALQREAKKCQMLAHPNIVRVYDFDRDGDIVYMTMEYLSGESLDHRIKESGNEGVPVNEVLRIVNGMSKALAFAHESGIVHADFKPANVFITDKGQVKVIDFGIARAFRRIDEPESLELTQFDPRLLGAITPSYASPEMLEKARPDPRDDIYALACTTYLLLTGSHPFGGVLATVARAEKLKLRRQTGLNRKQFKALKHALSFDREKRTPTIAQFLKEISPKHTLLKPSFISGGIVVGLMLMGGGVGYYLFIMGKVLLWERVRPSPIEANTAIRTETRYEPEDRKPFKPSSTLAQAVELISPLYLDLPCAAVNIASHGNRIVIHGIAKETDITRLAGEAKARARSIEVHQDIKPLDHVSCEVIELFAPYWLTNQKLGSPTVIQTKDVTAEFSQGDKLVLKISAPPYASYVNVDYFSLNGGVLHLLPSPSFPYNQVPANHAATIGDLGEWKVAPPFGTELIAMLATPEPLFDSTRKEYESLSDYLPNLRKRLKELVGKVGEKRIMADLKLIKTSP